jgi:hypothetical protein
MQSPDDGLTLAALGVLAFLVADVSHEALGHGLAILATGAKPVILTTSYFGSSGSASRWIPAGGGIANAAVGLLSFLLVRALRPSSPRWRYLLVLVLAFNLLFAAAYPAYSGIAAFGDWAGVISGLTPAWFWRLLLVVVAVVWYYVSLELIAVAIRPFSGSEQRPTLERLRRITLIPYLAALVAALVGGVLNPMGWTQIFTAALPAAAATFGLTQMDHFRRAQLSDESVPPAGPISRSVGWIGAAIVALLLFVGVLGPGIHFRE